MFQVIQKKYNCIVLQKLKYEYAYQAQLKMSLNEITIEQDTAGFLFFQACNKQYFLNTKQVSKLFPSCMMHIKIGS